MAIIRAVAIGRAPEKTGSSVGGADAIGPNSSSKIGSAGLSSGDSGAGNNAFPSKDGGLASEVPNDAGTPESGAASVLAGAPVVDMDVFRPIPLAL